MLSQNVVCLYSTVQCMDRKHRGAAGPPTEYIILAIYFPSACGEQLFVLFEGAARIDSGTLPQTDAI